MAEKMNESHQRFLQVLMSHGIMEGSAARALHKHCCEVHKVHYMHDKLDDFIGVINKHLQPIFMQIRKGMSEEDGQSYYALVNLAENEITRMASDYAENELELFRKTVELIILSDNGFASSTSILNLSDQLQTKKIRKKDTEQLLQSFVQEKWLIERDGEYTLHTRCIMEMEHYLQSTYQDLVKVCNICHSIAIQSQMCDTCGIPMHLPCVGRYFKGQKDPHCPRCNDVWHHDIPNLNQNSSQAPPSEKVTPRTQEARGANTSMSSRRSR
ncbi:non-structural maintenance of chromosomes element 1 homolog [Bombina bombina]|uniref:non-structural maintenance of chromosomes element 1 homolog n=1 Tax=Bombina bombina TaxID=8345 RepID=UPI00235A99E7|nr:non-structural maintenance of chromosomes element 1 homolog [Bombina bombina]XP_053550401.1 non-structural maintenance of chromosomes element 1 homolog [Bombina bombina]XP_053550402.1 non-structural maintenance of chromosomes element 1 homolog [Bombina bombina]